MAIFAEVTEKECIMENRGQILLCAILVTFTYWASLSYSESLVSVLCMGNAHWYLPEWSSLETRFTAERSNRTLWDTLSVSLNCVSGR